MSKTNCATEPSETRGQSQRRCGELRAAAIARMGGLVAPQDWRPWAACHTPRLPKLPHRRLTRHCAPTLWGCLRHARVSKRLACKQAGVWLFCARFARIVRAWGDVGIVVLGAVLSTRQGVGPLPFHTFSSFSTAFKLSFMASLSTCAALSCSEFRACKPCGRKAACCLRSSRDRGSRAWLRACGSGSKG